MGLCEPADADEFRKETNKRKIIYEPADAEGFRKETHKRPKIILKVNNPYRQPKIFAGLFDFSEVIEFQNIVDELRDSKFFTNFKEELLCALKILERNLEAPSVNGDRALDIVCYGLGNFMSSVESKHQLAFLIILKNMLSPRSVSIFDPVFSREEMCILEDFGLDVLNVNERGRRTISNRTIFFMPHCHRNLYNNLLSANWNIECLSQLIVIGNGLKMCPRTMKKRHFKKYISASKLATEIKFKTDFESVQVFDSLSMFYFHIDALCALPFRVWDDNTEPVLHVKDKPKNKNLCNSCEIYRDE